MLPPYPSSFINDHETYLDFLSLSSSSLKVPGADLQNVCHLQTPEDSSKILELATGRNVVVIGASFIGKRLSDNQVMEKGALKPTAAVCEDCLGPSGKGLPSTACLVTRDYSWGCVSYTTHQLLPLIARN